LVRASAFKAVPMGLGFTSFIDFSHLYDELSEYTYPNYALEILQGRMRERKDKSTPEGRPYGRKSGAKRNVSPVRTALKSEEYMSR
jgi:hypothetical protein